jgi:hypothetical protein
MLLFGSAKINRLAMNMTSRIFFQPSKIALVTDANVALASLSVANAKSTAASMPRLVLFEPRHCFGNFVMAN